MRAAAREATALLCKVLGYDGRQELRFQLRLETNSVFRHVFEDVEPGHFVRLLHGVGVCGRTEDA